MSNHTRTIVWLVGGALVLIVILLVFRAGMVVGYRQAEFSSEQENEVISVRRSPGGIFVEFGDHGPYINSHGSYGQIVTLNGSSMTVKDSTGQKTFILGSTTAIRFFPNNPNTLDASSTATLKIGEYVVIFGAPDQTGYIHADLIRVLPGPLPASVATSSSGN